MTTCASMPRDAAAWAPRHARSSVRKLSAVELPGIVIFDLETAHDAPQGTYAEKNLHECPPSQQHVWKNRSQIIEFAAVDVRTGERFEARCRPEFRWEDVISPAARAFARDHGHDLIIQDMELPTFADRWLDEVHPFLCRAAGSGGRLAMIAHCGDRFDFAVLSRELKKHGLPVDFRAEHFDPVRTLKQRFGPDFGGGGQLALRRLHERFVPPPAAPRAAHRALSDCEALLDIIQHWPDLRRLLAWEVAETMLAGGSVSSASALLCGVLASPPPPALGAAEAELGDASHPVPVSPRAAVLYQ